MVKRSDYTQINSLPDEGEEKEFQDEDEETERQERDSDEITVNSPFPNQIDSKLANTLKNNTNSNSKSPTIDELLNKWTSTIAQKVHLKNNNSRNKNRIKKRVIEDRDRDLPIEIMASVFEVWQKKEEGKGKGKEIQDEVMTLDHLEPMSIEIFNGLVERVKDAIEVAGVQPRLNSKGSSGSYFARDASGSTLAIFKPKDEEPYGRLNPKLTKWIHRNFLSKVIPFGRACLIPQLSYLSESAASLIDRRLEAHIVPRTEVVDLTSPAFYYDWIDRERAKPSSSGLKGRKLPEKPGSFQVFLKGFQDATIFLKTHPYPGRPLAQTLDPSAHRKHRINLLKPFECLCGKADAEGEEFDENGEEVGWGWGGEDDGTPASRERRKEKEESFKWTEDMMNSFRVELEKLVIFDYIIRNTDRGLDNFMIKGCMCAKPTTSNDIPVTDQPLGTSISSMSSQQPFSSNHSSFSSTTGRENRSSSSSSATTSTTTKAHIHIAAIDNSLAFPHSHPVGWRSYNYGWLHLPVSLIGAPFSNKTREHYLPLLSSPSWWAQTTLELRREFSKDPDFKESMFRKQMAVMKGQAWNIVQSLKDPSDGPLELCRRGKKLVWDDLIEVADDHVTQSLINNTSLPPSLSSPNPISTTSRTNQDSSPTTPSKISTSTEPDPTLSPILATHPPRTDFSLAHSLPIVPLLRRSSSDNRHKSNTPLLGSSGRRVSVLSLSVNSKIPEDEFGSITGAEMIKRLDKVEKEGQFDIDELDENGDDSEGEAEGEGDIGGSAVDHWGIRSENDLRRSTVTSISSQHHHSRNDSYSFDLERNSISSPNPNDQWRPRNRSGSLSSILNNVGVNVGRNSNNRRKSSGGNNKYSTSNSSSSNSIHRGDISDVEGDGRKVVVVERIESVEEMPVFSWF